MTRADNIVTMLKVNFTLTWYQVHSFNLRSSYVSNEYWIISIDVKVDQAVTVTSNNQHELTNSLFEETTYLTTRQSSKGGSNIENN